MGLTLKQSQRLQYVRLCKAYNSADPRTVEFISLSVQLHAAKGWEHITKHMARHAFVRRCGKDNKCES